MTQQSRETVKKEFEEKFANPDKLSSRGQFRPELQDRLYQEFESFIDSIISTVEKETMEEVEKLRKRGNGSSPDAIKVEEYDDLQNTMMRVGWIKFADELLRQLTQP